MRAARTLLVLLGAAAVVFAGCLPPPAPPPDSTDPPTPTNACSGFEEPSLGTGSSASGDNAFAYMLLLVCDFSGEAPEPRYRIPGTEGQREAAVWLHDTLAGHGWDAEYQNFTGADYAAVEDKDGASTYFSNAAFCSEADRQRLDDLPFSNVVATLEGSGSETLILMAHYDSKLHANQDDESENQTEPVLGANDGASGVGVLLEVARVLAMADPAVTVTILLTDGEDGFDDCHALAGSVWYVDMMTQEQRNAVSGVLLLDMVGNAEDEFTLAGNSDALKERVAAAAESVGLDAVVEADRRGPSWVLDDHSPFMHHGMDAVDLIPSSFAGTDYWHTTHDTPDLLSAELMGMMAQMTVTFVDRSA